MGQEEEHALSAEERLRLLEIGHKVLVDQAADIAVEMKDMEQRIEQAVANGVVSGFDQLLERKKKQAAESTGRWIWGFLKDFLARWLLIGGVVLTVGKLAGWGLAVQLWDALTGKIK